MHISLDPEDYKNIDLDKLKLNLNYLGYTKFFTEKYSEYRRKDNCQITVPPTKELLDYIDVMKQLFGNISKDLNITEGELYNNIMGTKFEISSKDKMLFLATGEVSYSSYNNRHDRIFTDTRLVIAKDRNEAHDKFKAYWEDKSEDYSHTYNCLDITINETIE